MKTIKIISSNTVKGGGSHPSGRKPKNMKAMPISTTSSIKGGGNGPTWKP
jgi:hypothetical protein